MGTLSTSISLTRAKLSSHKADATKFRMGSLLRRRLLVLCALVRFARSDTAFHTTGECSASESCVSSPNYPANYGNSEACTITPQASGTLSVTSFSTESGFDHLTIDGVWYDGTTGPDGVSVSPSTSMSWTSVTWAGGGQPAVARHTGFRRQVS